jgi:pimeloyl-ACP methyl ester carboxylesterase
MPRLYWTQGGRSRLLGRYAAMLKRCPVPSEQRHIATCMGETFVLSCGPDTAPPLVLLHGGNTNSLMWLRSLPVWTRHFRVHAVDTIGDPGFSAPVRPALASDAYARWLDDVWSGLGVARAAVVAASFGGWLGLDYTIRRPERVGRLALLAPAGIVRMDTVSQLKVAALTMLGARGRRKALDMTFGVDPDSLGEEGHAFLDFQGLVQTSFLSRIALPKVITDTALRGIKAPLLVVLGEKDIFFRVDPMRQRIAACLPQARVHRLPGVGHGLGDTTDLVTRFLVG